MEPLLREYAYVFKPALAANEVQIIFGNIVEIQAIHQDIWNFMERKIAPEVNAQMANFQRRTYDAETCNNKLAAIFLEKSEQFKAYVEYTANYTHSVAALTRLQKNSAFQDFLKVKKSEYGSLGLVDYLVKPLQSTYLYSEILIIVGLLKYPLFFRELIKLFGGNILLVNALEKIESVNQYVNNCKGDLENMRRMEEIQNQM
jgi:hypothetical protein